MDMIVLAASGGAVLCGFAAVSFYVKSERYKSKLAPYMRQLEELDALRSDNKSYLEAKSAAQAELKQTQKQLEQLQDEREQLLHEKELALTAKLEAQKQVELTEQKMNDMQLRMKDWEAWKVESVQAAKAAVLQAGGEMSSKLLADHKRETEEAKKQSEEVTKKTNETLILQFKTVTETVASIRDVSNENKEKMATVWRALTTPAGAGHLAEVGLENSLKNLGLDAGRDFIMQYAITGAQEGGGLRPDAVIFLPQNMVMVIDSKASKHVMEIAEVEGTPLENEALDRLAKSMNQHLKTLSSKDYRNAILQSYKSAGRSGEITMVFNVMYVPSEAAIEKIKRADAEFMHKVEKAELILAGPASLAGLLSLARMNIGLARQADNQHIIIEAVQNLMDSVITTLSYTENIGKGIKSAADNFSKLAGSVNSRVMPRLRSLASLGVKPAKNKELTMRIHPLDVRVVDDAMMIDAEVESVEDLAQIIDLHKKVESN